MLVRSQILSVFCLEIVNGTHRNVVFVDLRVRPSCRILRVVGKRGPEANVVPVAVSHMNWLMAVGNKRIPCNPHHV